MSRGPTPRSLPIPVEPETFIVGLRKIGPKDKIGQTRYAVVTGTLSNPIIDPTPEPLEFAAEMMKRGIHHLLDNLK